MAEQLRTPALVIIDVQQAIDDPRWGPRNNRDAEARIAEMLAQWRRRGLPVVHVRHDSTEPDSPYRPDRLTNGFKSEATPLSDEPVVAKGTNSAFVDTELEALLRDIAQEVVFAGVLTHNSLEATVRMAGNLGFDAFVASDACWSVEVTDLRGITWSADDVHALSLAIMDGEYATVATVDQLIAALPA